MNRNAIRRETEAEIDSDTLERDDTIIGVALRWSLAAFAIVAALVGVAAYYFRPVAAAKPTQESHLAQVELRSTPKVTIPYVKFTDITNAAGVDFRHRNAASGRKLLPE